MSEQEDTQHQKILEALKKLSEVLRNAQEIRRKTLVLLIKRKELILLQQSQDLEEIVDILDGFISLAYYELGEEEFLDFLQYVYKVDEDLAFDAFRLHKKELELLHKNRSREEA